MTYTHFRPAHLTEMGINVGYKLANTLVIWEFF